MNTSSNKTAAQTRSRTFSILAASIAAAAMLTVAAPRANAQWQVGVAVGAPAYEVAPAPPVAYGYAPVYSGPYYDHHYWHEQHEAMERERRWEHERWERERHFNHERGEHERWEHEHRGW